MKRSIALTALPMPRRFADPIERERNAERSSKKRNSELLSFVQHLQPCYGQVQSLPRGVLAALLTRDAGIVHLVRSNKRLAR